MSLIGQGITMQFGGITALSGVDIEVIPGRVTALIGSNGAGKSTLINCLTGVLQPTSGSVYLEELDITARSPEARVSDGLARTFQTPRVDQASTVRENVMIGCYARTRSRLFRTILRSPQQRLEEREVAETSDAILRDFDLESVSHKRAGDLPVWQMRILEIARAATMNPKYILLDEPAAGLDHSERERLGEFIQSLAVANVGVLLVEHNFNFVRAMSNDLFVLDKGTSLARGSVEEIANNPDVIASYLKGGSNATK